MAPATRPTVSHNDKRNTFLYEILLTYVISYDKIQSLSINKPPMADKQISFTLSLELRDELMTFCKEHDIVMSRLMRRLIKDYLLTHEDGQLK